MAAFCVFSRVALADGSGNENTANESSNHQATGDQGAGDEGSGEEGSGDEGSGDEGSGDEGSGDEGSGDEGSGDEGSGGEGSGDEGAGNEGQALGFSQGQETEIQVGSVVGSATLRDSMCVIHTPIKIGARVQNGSSPLAISWRFDEQCRAVVYDIQPISEAENTLAHTAPAENGQFISPVPGLVPSGGEPMATEDTGVDSSSREERAGWVGYTILEQFDVPATYVYAHLYYWEEDDSVSGGHSPYAYCWNSWFPGWTIEDCSSTYYPHGPDYVWIEVEGEFQNDLNIEYTMYAQWYGTAYGYSYTCDLTEGALPIFWEEVCRGGKIQQP